MANENRENRKNQHWAARRRSVIKAARTVLAHDGLEGATIRAIAAQAGYSPAAVYQYFATREEVLAAVLQLGLDRLAAAVVRSAQRVAEADAAGKVMALGRALRRIYDHFRQHPGDVALAAYLVGTVRQVADGPQTGIAQLVSRTLSDAVRPLAHELASFTGVPRAEAETRLAGLVAQMFGLMILEVNPGPSGTLLAVETERVLAFAIAAALQSPSPSVSVFDDVNIALRERD